VKKNPAQNLEIKREAEKGQKNPGRRQDILRERAAALSRPLDKKVTRKEKIVVFSLEDEWYGLFAAQVREILKPEKVTVVPGAPKHIRGLTNLRGEITSVTDPKRLLGLQDTPLTEKSRLVVVETEAFATALLVDSVTDIQDISVDELEAPLVTLDKAQLEFLKGEVRVGDKLLSILNLEKLLKDE